MSKPGKVLKELCKKLGVRLTVKRGKKRVYKSIKVLKRQCSKKKKRKKKKLSRGNKYGKKKRTDKKNSIMDTLGKNKGKIALGALGTVGAGIYLKNYFTRNVPIGGRSYSQAELDGMPGYRRDDLMKQYRDEQDKLRDKNFVSELQDFTNMTRGLMDTELHNY